MSHLTYTTLLGYIGDELSPADRNKIEDHLFSDLCKECGRKLARLQKVLKAVATDKSVAPSPQVLTKAFGLFQERPAPAQKSLSQVLAVLQFDSRLQFSAMAMRGTIRSRQMLFTADDMDIDLQMTAEDGGHNNLTGQILGIENADQTPQAFVSLKDETGQLLSGTQTDAQGQFTFRQLPPGVYHLVFDLDSQEISISRLELVND